MTKPIDQNGDFNFIEGYYPPAWITVEHGTGIIRIDPKAVEKATEAAFNNGFQAGKRFICSESQAYKTGFEYGRNSVLGTTDGESND